MKKLALHWWIVIAAGLVGLGALDLGVIPWIFAAIALVGIGFKRRPYWSSVGGITLVWLGYVGLALHWWVLIGVILVLAALMSRMAQHWVILTGMVAGVLFGLYSTATGVDEVVEVTLVTPGTEYSVSDVLSIAGGTDESASITVDTVDAGGAIATFTLTPGGNYAVDPSTPNSPTGGAGSGASFELATRDIGVGDVLEYVAPVGTLFLNLLRMIAVPLVLFSLVAGVASLRDTAKLSRIGGKTILLYLGTTAVAITIGLLVVNIVQPGSGLSEETREEMKAQMIGEFGDEAAARVDQAGQVSIIDQLVNIVPTNPFNALADAQMLQVVFFALILGVALIRIGEKANHVISVFQLLSEAVINMVHLIMKIAAFGVFALMAAVIARLGEDAGQLTEFLEALLQYMGTVILGLFLHLLLVYTFLLKFVAKVPLKHFFRSIVPAQLLAFSSSSSGATLPVTMECVEKKVGVHEEVSSFVLPLGATINMDGTGLYQGVAAVFIATFYGMDLSLGQQLQIVLTASLASIGTAAVPGVGIIMLTIVLQQIGVPPQGIALILGVDRPLDMCRTVLNVTGDATVATTVASTEGLIEIPQSAARSA